MYDPTGRPPVKSRVERHPDVCLLLLKKVRVHVCEIVLERKLRSTSRMKANRDVERDQLSSQSNIDELEWH